MPLRISNPDDIRRLRDALLAASYTPVKINEHIGWPMGATSPFDEGPALLYSLRDDPKLRAICALFLLQMPVSKEDAAEALAPAGIASLIDAGLLRLDGGTVWALFRIIPVRETFVVCDLKVLGRELPPDIVMGASISSSILMAATMRRPSRRTLDLCAGSGIQAMEAAAHSEAVICAEKNPRAIRLGEFSAVLNGRANVEFRESDFYSAAESERFDLIVANPPYVISPEHEFQFRDGGLGADRVAEHIVRNAPRFLADGGFCQVLCDWANYKGAGAEKRLSGWAAGTGCDMVVIRGQTTRMKEYPLTWLADYYSNSPVQYQRKYQTWVEYFEREGIESMTFGMIVLRRREAAHNWFYMTGDALDVGRINGGELERIFAAKDFLEENASDEALLSQCLALNKDVRFDQRLIQDAEGWNLRECALAMSDSRVPPVSTDPYLGGLCGRLQGDRTLREIVAEMAAAMHADPGRLAGQVTPVIRGLIERGLVNDTKVETKPRLEPI
jgi:methylase of polypeptide subunit release factors